MKQPNPQKLDSKVFSLASNLFGFGTSTTKEQIQNTIAKDVAKLQIDNTRIMAVFPAITEEAFATTMDNYRQYISAYNFKTAEENEQTIKHNTAVRIFRKSNKLSDVQLEYSRIFQLNNSKLKPREYNIKADEFCKEYGLIVEKQKVQLVKFPTEIIFQNLLHLYNSQLMKRNEQYMRLHVTTPRPIEEFKINSFLVTQLKRKEINSLALCSKTVRNHRQRLEECGVFVEYAYRGQNKAVEVHINPEILTVYDLKTAKLTSAVNQHVTPELGNVLPDNNENTRTLQKEYKRNENASSSQLIRSSLSLTPSYLFSTGTPTSNDGKKEKQTEGAGEKSVKVSNILSEKLEALIIHPQELAINLANQEYNNYRPIDIRYLFKEAYSGTLTNDEFRELCLQDFFKTSAKIWKASTPFAGSWKKAITLYYQNKWIAFTGNSFNKSALVDDIQQMRWRIEWARKWFIKNKEVSPLFPFDYFDVTRKTSKEVGFEYTKRKWTEHLKSIEKYEALKKKQEGNAKRRLETINHAKKCENEINRFLKDRITLSQLFDYVQRNLPKEYLEKLPDMISKKTLQKNDVNMQNGFVDDLATYNIYDFE